MTAPKAHINVSGTWKEILKMHVNVSGTWKRVNKAYVNVAGTWKQFLQSASPSTFSGLFSTTAATANFSSSTRTYTLGAGNSGQLRFASLVNAGSDTLYNKNGAGLISIVSGDVITLASTDTLLLRVTGMPAASVTALSLVDVDTGTTIEAVSMTRT